MTSIGAYEAKTHLARLLDEVEAGNSVTITRHGREVARLVPPSTRTVDADTAIDELLDARKGVRRGRSTVRKMIDEGRR